MLKQRLITACILIPMMLAILFYANATKFAIITALLCLLAAWEWAALSGWKTIFPRCIYVFSMSGLFVGMLFLPPPLILWLAILWWLSTLPLVLMYPRGEKCLYTFSWVKGLMGYLVILPCWAAINTLRAEPGGEMGVLFLFVLVFGADTTAYFAGKRLGRRKLLPVVSPGKTWEGAFAAMIFATLLSLLVLRMDATPYVIWPWVILLCWVTVAASILGDLFESLIKRVAGVKDSGEWLPGHGGLMDRIDSLSAAAPVFVFGAYLLSQYL